MSSPSTPKPEPRRRSSARQPAAADPQLDNRLATKTTKSLIAAVGAASTSLPAVHQQCALSSAQTATNRGELARDESPCVDPHLIFDPSDLSRVRAGSLQRIVDCLADKTVRVSGAQRIVLRDDVAALFLTHRAFGIDTVALINLVIDRYRSAPAAHTFGKPELDSADRAAVDMRFRKRAGAVALLERWAVVAPLDFFEEQILFTDSPRDTADSSEAGAHGSPDVVSRRQSQLRHSTNPDMRDEDDEDHDRAKGDMQIDGSSASTTSNDDESPTPVSSASIATSTTTTTTTTTQTDEDADEDGLLTSPTKRPLLQYGGGLRRSIGSMRQLRPQVAAFFRTEHGRFARRVAAIEAQLLSALEPLSVESREIVEITSVIEDGITAQAPSSTPTVGNLWNPSVRAFDEPSVLAVSPSVLAGALSSIEYTLMARVAESPQQLLRQAWNSQDRATVAPDVLRYIGWFNMASRWVAVELVKPQQQEMRSRVLAHFIHTAVALHALGNYNGLFEIMAALHSAAISRMKATWAALTDADRDSFASLTEFCAPARNYRRLRDALAQKDDGARLPYLGVFLTDQTSIDDSVADWIDMTVDGQSVTLLNFAKARQSAQLLINLRRWLRVPYARVKREQRLHVLACVAAAHSWDDSKVFQLSQLREPGASASAAALSAAAASDENALVSTDRDELTPSDWQLLRVHSELVRFAPGDVILASGEPSDVLYVVVSGECALLIDVDASQSALMSAATSANNSGSPTPERRRSSVLLARSERRLSGEVGGDGPSKSRFVARRAAGSMFNIYGFVTAQLGDVPPSSWCRVVATTACEVRRLDSSYVHSVLADWHDLAHRFFQSAAWSLVGVLEVLLTSQDAIEDSRVLVHRLSDEARARATCDAGNDGLDSAESESDDEGAPLSVAAVVASHNSVPVIDHEYDDDDESSDDAQSAPRRMSKVDLSVDENVHNEFRAEFKVGRDQTPLGDAPYLVKRRGGIWANAHVYVTSHYLCLRQRLFRLTTRETLSLFDVTEMFSNERGDLLVCATELDAKGKAKKHERVLQLRGVPAASGGRDLGPLIRSLWEALPKVTGAHQRRLLAQLAAHGLAGRADGVVASSPPTAAATAALAADGTAAAPRHSLAQSGVVPLSARIVLPGTPPRRNTSEDGGDDGVLALLASGDAAERARLAESFQNDELSRERVRRRLQREFVVRKKAERRSTVTLSDMEALGVSSPTLAAYGKSDRLQQRSGSPGLLRQSSERRGANKPRLVNSNDEVRATDGRRKTTVHVPTSNGLQLSSSGENDGPSSPLAENSRDLEKLTEPRCNLSQSDWKMLLESARVMKFKRGDVIVTQGESYQRIFQVISGTCLIVNTANDGVCELHSTVQGGESFGEASFLTGEPALRSVVAAEDVELYVIEGYFVHLLFGVQPHLGGRFFNFLARAIGNRLATVARATTRPFDCATSDVDEDLSGAVHTAIGALARTSQRRNAQRAKFLAASDATSGLTDSPRVVFRKVLDEDDDGPFFDDEERRASVDGMWKLGI